MSRFGMLLRYYRRQSTDPDKGGMLTQERLGELLGREPGNTRYSGAAISDWDRGKSEINHNYRSVLVGLIKVLYACGGMSSLSEANELLISGNYRSLNEEETRIIFPIELPTEAINAETSGKDIFLHILEMKLSSLSELIKDLFGTDNNSDLWSARLLKRVGEIADSWSAERFLPYLGWIWIWLLTLWLTFPLLRWPFDSQEKALEATLKYVTGALVLPIIIGIQTNTRNYEFWQERQLANSPALRFFTHIGAAVAFHVGYMMVVAVWLLGYYLGLDPILQWLSPLAAFLPVILGAAAARQVPIDQLKAYGELRLQNGAVFILFFLFGPIWGTFFYHYSPILLSPTYGFPLVFVALVGWASLTGWQKRRQLAFIPVHIWAAILGIPFFLYLVSHGISLFGVTVYFVILATLIVLVGQNRILATLPGGISFFVVASLLLIASEVFLEAGRIATVLAFLIWFLWGRKHLRVPPGFWVVIAVIIGFGLLVRSGGLDQIMASISLAIIALGILLIQAGALRHNREIA